MGEVELATLSGFKVSKEGIGSVEWEGKVDVRGVVIDQVVSIAPKAIAVYEEEEKRGEKPKEGEMLNRPAIITLMGIYPKGAGENGVDLGLLDAETKDKFRRKIEKSTKKMGAEFIRFDMEDGIWVFRTLHFSRYGLDDSDDDSDDENRDITNNVKEGQHQQHQQHQQQVQPVTLKKLDFRYGGRGGRLPRNNREVIGLKFGGNTSRREDGMDGSRMEENRMNRMDRNRMETDRIIEEAEGAYGDLMMIMDGGNARGATTESAMEDDSNSLPATTSIVTKSNRTNKKTSNVYRKEVRQYSMPPPQPPSRHRLSAGRLSSPEEGICARSRAKAKLQQTKSQVDVSAFLGRSFHANFTNGDNVINIQNTNGRKVRVKRPDWTSEHAEQAEHDNVDLLKVHLKNSEDLCRKDGNVNNRGEGTLPRFSLPMGPSQGGNVEEYARLCRAVDDYEAMLTPSEGSDELYHLPARAFGLIVSLYCQEESYHLSSDDDQTMIDVASSDKASSDPSNMVPTEDGNQDGAQNPSLQAQIDRRRAGFRSWLASAISNDCQRVISDTKDVHTAIFFALLCDDVGLASKIALESGEHRLAVILSSGFASAELVREQLAMWEETGAMEHISPSLLRVYNLLSGEISTEAELYRAGQTDLDWRQFLMMRSLADNAGFDGARTSIPELITNFEQDVRQGRAPFPSPRYGTNDSKDVCCLLMRILKLRRSGGGNDGDLQAELNMVTCPSGYSTNPHDYGLSFHLCAVLRSLGAGPPMGPSEALNVVNGLVGQLVAVGNWHWAVYVCCCGWSLVAADEVQQVESACTDMARGLIERNFIGDATTSQFLSSQVGIDDSWLHQALALRSSALHKDSFRYVKELLTAGDIKGCVSATKDLLVPHFAFGGEQRQGTLRDLLSALRDGRDHLTADGDDGESSDGFNDINGCGPVLEFMELPDLIRPLCCGGGSPRILQDLCQRSEKISSKFPPPSCSQTQTQTQTQAKDGFLELNPCAAVEKHQQVRLSCLSRIRSSLAVMRLQLLTLREGGTVDPENIGEIKALPKAILDAALRGQTIDDHEGLFPGNEFATVRALASFVIETI